jgi:hypothetical protein
MFADICEAKAREFENGELSGEWEDATDFDHFLAEQQAAFSSVGPGVQQQQQQGLGYSSHGMGGLGGDAVGCCSSSGVSDVTEVDWLELPGGIADAAGSSAPAAVAAVAAVEGAAAADSNAGSSPPTAAVQAITAANSSAGSSPPVLWAAAASGGEGAVAAVAAVAAVEAAAASGGEGAPRAVQAGLSRAAEGMCTGPAWDDLD